MSSRGPISCDPLRDSRKKITADNNNHKHEKNEKQQVKQLTIAYSKPEIKLLKRSSHPTFLYYLKMLIISASFVIINKQEVFTFKVAAQQLDLIELSRQQQQLQPLSSESPSFVSSPTHNKRLGMLECVAKLHGRFHALSTQLSTNGNNNQNQLSITPAQSQQHAPQQAWPPSGGSSGHSQPLLLNHSNHGEHHDEHHQGVLDNRPQIIFLPSGDSGSQSGEEEPRALQPVDDGDPEGQQVVEQGDDAEGSLPDDQQVVEEQFVDQAEGEEGDEQADLLPDYEDQQQQQRQEVGVHNVSGTTTIYQDRRDAARRTWTGGLTALASRLKPPDLTNALKRRRAATNKRGHPRRFKRQAAPSDGGQQAAMLTNSIAQLITNALLGARQRNAQFGQLQASNPLDSSANQAATPNPVQVALGTVVPIGQQLLNELLSQGARDIPVRMANVGQLLANLIVTLTVNNPVLVNSPLLARARPILRQATSGGNQLPDAQPVGIMSVLTNVIRALNQSQPTMGRPTPRPTLASTTLPPPPPSPTEIETSLPPMSTFPPTLDFEPTVSSLFAPDSLLLAASQRIDRKSGQAFANKTSSSTVPRRKVNDHKTKIIKDQDSGTVAFVRRLNAFTTGEVLSKNVTRLKENSKQRTTKQKGTQRTGRNKRSLGALMMFGPFSKFYMAMTLHRLMKYQSGVLSQAVMGELVRRYVIPGFSSALTGGSGSSNQASQQLINQARQIFMRSTNPSNPAADASGLRGNITRSPSVGSVSQNVDFTSKPMTQQELLLQQLRSLGPDQKTAEAECEFQHANGLDLLGRAIRFTTPLDMQQLYQLLQTSWGSYYSHAMSNPLVSFEPGRGLTISLPISQSSMTIPSLRTNRQQALVELLTQSSAHDARRPSIARGRPDLHQLLLHHPHSAHQSSHVKPKRRPNRYQSGAPNHLHPTHPDDLEPTQQHQIIDQDGNELDSRDLRQGDVQQVLSAFLKQASPDQLFEVLNKTILASPASEVRPRHAQKLGIRLKEKIANEHQSDQIQKQQLKLLQALMGSLNKTDGREGVTSKDSVSGLADKLLSQSLTSLMESLLEQNSGGGSGNDVQNQGGKQQLALMNSMMLDSSSGGGDEGRKLSEKMVAQFLGSLNQHRRRPEQHIKATVTEEIENNKPMTRDINPGIQLTLTADNATTLMEKLMALTGTNKTTEQMRNASLMDSNESILQPQEQRNELVRLDHHLVQPTLPSGPPVQLRSRPLAPYQNVTSIQGQPQSVLRSGHAMVSLAKQVSTSVQSERLSSASLMNNNNHTTRQQLFSKNMTLVHNEPNGSMRRGNGTIALATRSDDVHPMSRASHVGPNLTDHQVVSVSEPTRHQVNQSQESNGQPLNNLAMALNVMNMVMLNQRLMSASNSTGSGQPPMMPRASTATTISGNFSLNNSRILLPSASTKHKTRPIKLVSGRPRPLTGQTKLARAKYTNANTGQMAAYIYPTRKAVVVNATTIQSTNIGSTAATTTTTSAPEFVLLNMTRSSKSADRKPNASDSIQSANHRTSTNTIRLHQNLSLLETTAKPTATSTTAPPKYYFQPLVTKFNSSLTDQNDKAKLRLSSQKIEESVEPESDHANRWNDVLQHIDLPTLSG